MKDQAAEVTDFAEKEVAFMEQMKADADKTATALIQSYLRDGPQGHRHSEVPLWVSQALREAREHGEVVTLL
jgi:hypothetical protein